MVTPAARVANSGGTPSDSRFNSKSRGVNGVAGCAVNPNVQGGNATGYPLDAGTVASRTSCHSVT